MYVLSVLYLHAVRRIDFQNPIEGSGHELISHATKADFVLTVLVHRLHIVVSTHASMVEERGSPTTTYICFPPSAVSVVLYQFDEICGESFEIVFCSFVQVPIKFFGVFGPFMLPPCCAVAKMQASSGAKVGVFDHLARAAHSRNLL